MAQAEAFERGDGQPRDYAQAAAIYAERCDHGKGDRVACRRLLMAIERGRGIDFDRGQLHALAGDVCTAARDHLACLLFMMLSDDDAIPPIAREVLLDRKASCDAANLDVCEAKVQAGSSGDGTAAQEHRQRLVASACELGVIDACVELLRPLTDCLYSAGQVECGAAVRASWVADQDRGLRDAAARLDAACDRGDADACDALPGRAIPWSALCEAHDYHACAAMQCLAPGAAGDPTVHGAEANCLPIQTRDEVRNLPPRAPMTE
jgi:TPR repeat protein